ncbi:LamG-like jellyroll fold domain-containing protein [Candidatus Nanosalina sp. VS9-1]|uniref:LamG-like jellyroll fold domain-containing protein n=1 Tax=Candidatus Nanosalina sp. VS9-1 TaxID=3388566 RepID=UPI0039DF6C14
MTKNLNEATVHPDKVRPSSAVSRWSMDSSDVSSGVISDSWGSNDGSLNGGITTGASGVGGSEAFSFDGSDDYVNVPHSFASTFGSSSFSVSFWFKTSDTSGNVPIIDNRDESAGFAGFYSWIIQGYLRISIDDGSNDEIVYRTTQVVADGNWHHAVVMRDNDKDSMRILLDGTEAETTAYDPGSPASYGSISHSKDTQIGARYDDSNGSVTSGNSEIDEVRIYSEALSQQQVWKLYNVGRNANWGFSRS